jgi:signal transduction histidine kinase
MSFVNAELIDRLFILSPESGYVYSIEGNDSLRIRMDLEGQAILWEMIRRPSDESIVDFAVFETKLVSNDLFQLTNRNIVDQGPNEINWYFAVSYSMEELDSLIPYPIPPVSFIGSYGIEIFILLLLYIIFIRRIRLQNSIRLLREAVEKLDQGIVILDSKFSLLYENPVVSQFEFDIYDCISQNRARPVFEFQLAQGGWIRIIQHHVASRVYGGEVTVVLIQDISSEMKARDEILSARIAAEEANERKSQFLSNMTHELRTPLNAIIGFSELLKDSVKDPEEQEFAETVFLSANLLNTLIRDVIDFSLLESDELVIENLPLRVHSLMERLEKTLRPSIESANIEFIFDTELAPEIWDGDANRIQQILLAFLNNAMKFTRKGSIWLKSYLAEENLVFEVGDTGIGIAEDKISSIFEPFVQGDGSKVRQYSGTGLGLSLSLRLAEKMGGFISVDAKEGAGSVFKLVLMKKK